MKQITGSEKSTAEQKKTDDKTLFSKNTHTYIYIQNAFLTELKLFMPNFSFHA